MNRPSILIVFSCIAFSLVFLPGIANSLSAQEKQAKAKTEKGEQHFEVSKVDEETPKVFRKHMTKMVTVFDIRILATEKTPNEKILHAANVLAQYLDNDADGKPDNESVVNAMVKNRATLIMAATERSFEKMVEKLESETDLSDLESMVLQSLYGSETHPDGASRGVFDGSLEEVLHLITHAGYAHAYPDVFGEKPGTKLGDAMDKARGGRFRRIPKKYPEGAWYSYDDRTCDYGCQAAEYIYWGLTSLLGAQEFKGREREIRHEWRLNTPEKFKNGDKLLHALLTDKQYKFPTKLPDGKYQPKKK